LVRFEYLSAGHISSFVSSVLDSIDRRLWESISRRLISRLDSLKALEFPLQEAKSLAGSISYLTRKYCGNVHDEGILTITSKSLFPGFALRDIAGCVPFRSNASQVIGFAGISAKCASARLITQSELEV
jgi:hypothetical protein